MRKYIEKHFEFILIIFLLFQPLLDIITSIGINSLSMNITIGILVRTTFLLFIIYCTLFVFKKKKTIKYYIPIIIYSILYIIGIFKYKENNYFGEIQGLIKTIYFPLLLISLYMLKDYIKLNKRTLITVLVTYIVYTFVPIMLNIGYESYAITKEGTLGFFNSANELGGIISILTPFLFMSFKTRENILIKIIFLIMYFIVILNIGTKTPLLVFFITICFVALFIIKGYIKSKKYRSVILSIESIIIGIELIILVLPSTAFYKNIKTHLDFLEVDSIVDVFKDEKLIDHFIFSQRLTFLEGKKEVFNASNTFQKLVGIGYYKDGKQFKAIEMDYFDIFYSHGYLGTLIFFLPYILILLSVLNNQKKKNFIYYMKNVSILIILLLSLFTGHIILAPSVSLIVVFVILYEEKKRILINARKYSKEKSLTYILNNIDSNKYDIVLTLEDTTIVPDNITTLKQKKVNTKNIRFNKVIKIFNNIVFLSYNLFQYDKSICMNELSNNCLLLTFIGSNERILYLNDNYRKKYKDIDKTKSFFNKIKIKKFNHIIFNCKETKTDFNRLYKKLNANEYIINNFVDYTTINNETKKKIKIDKRKDYILYIGDSTEIKKIESIAKKLSINSNSVILVNEDITLDEKYNIKKYNKDSIYSYIKNCKLVLNINSYDIYPNIYNEIIYLEKPIVLTSKVSDEIIDISRFGIVSKPTVNDICKNINKILNKDIVFNESIDFSKVNAQRIRKVEEILDK